MQQMSVTLRSLKGNGGAMDETGFVTDLSELAAKGDWRTWNHTRLVYADWLSEHRPEDEAIARAEWTFRWQRKHKDEVIQAWAATLPKNLKVDELGRLRKLFDGVVNGSRILHFEPLTLRAQNPLEVEGRQLKWIGQIYFTHLADRSSKSWLDTGAHRMGFKALFHPDPGPF